MSVAMIAPLISEKNAFMKLNEVESGDEDVNELDADEWNEDTAEAVDKQIALQGGQRADRRVFYAPQGERDQRNDDEGVENDRAQNGAGRTVQPHDVERRDRRERGHEHCGNDGEVFGDIVRDAERRQGPAGDQHLFPDFDDVNELG